MTEPRTPPASRVIRYAPRARLGSAMTWARAPRSRASTTRVVLLSIRRGLAVFTILPREHGFEPLRITGALPPELIGTLYRNGPGQLAVAGERYCHWFDGDGAIVAVRFAEGRALGAARLVQTNGFLREKEAKRRLFGSYGTPMARPFREMFLKDTKNPANTSVLLWNGRLFATCEAGKPYEVSTRDLETIGERDLEGVVVGAFSAHAHYVAARRTTYNFGITRGKKTRIDAYALPDGGRASRIATFSVDGVRMNHDFAVTDRHLVFAIAPARMSLLDVVFRRRAPAASMRWRAEEGTEIIVVPIDDPERILRFKAPAFLLEHVSNAFEDEAGRIVIDYTHYPDFVGLDGFVRGFPRGVIDAPITGDMRRATIDPRRGVMTTETILARPAELPRVSPLVEARRHRFTYCLGFTEATPTRIFDALLKQDLETGSVDTYAPGAAEFPGEGVFVPRPRGASEDDGWLLTFVYDARSDATRLDVLDACAIGRGPIASCHFDHPIPFGFHGAWAAGRGTE